MATTVDQFKTTLLDIHADAMALFDLVESRGVDGLLDGLDGIVPLKRIECRVDELLAFMFVQNLARMRALGMTVDRMPGHRETVRRLLGGHGGR